ncbi:UDP-glucose 4-epimerase (EC [Olavius sp. associated proteobacterium Delta 1]|nr:UDP-glucose 4-epimerase (EC [Olavius sp. associated proteobacterium Delta 1]
MKLLITGTNGFIGRNLKEYFQDRHCDLYFPKREQLDLLDSKAVYEYLKRNEFEIVIHCGVNISSVEENLKMYFNLERCSGFYGKMLCLGSGAEYDMNNYIPRMKETYFGKNMPSDIYGFSKYIIARDIESIPRNIYNLRIFGIYGKYENYQRRFISNNIYRVLCGQDISINQNMLFDYLFMADFVRIVEKFMYKDTTRRTYNVCTGKRIDLLSLAEIIKEVDGGRRKIHVKKDGFKPEYSGDNTLFLREYGKFDFTPPGEAIRKLYHWYKTASGITFEGNEII